MAFSPWPMWSGRRLGDDAFVFGHKYTWHRPSVRSGSAIADGPVCRVRCTQRGGSFLKRLLISRPKISIEQAAGREKTHDGQRDGGAARILGFFAV